MITVHGFNVAEIADFLGENVWLVYFFACVALLFTIFWEK